MKSLELKFPTVIGLLVAVGGLVSGLLLVQNQVRKSAQANSDTTPIGVVVSNISDSGFVVSWTTDKSATGYVQYGEDENLLDITLADDRDQERGTVTSYLTHFVTLKGLKPNTSYRFKIGSDKRMYDLNGRPYQIATGAQLVDQPPADVAYGQVVNENNEPASGAIVYLQMKGGVRQAALVEASGAWVIPLATIRNADLSSYLEYDKKTEVISIEVKGEVEGTTMVKTTTSNSKPVPEITLGEDADHTILVIDQPVTASDSAVISKLDPTSLNVSDLKIVSPRVGEGVNSMKPEIIGNAPAGTEVMVEIHSDEAVNGTVVADGNGVFSYSVPEDLLPGEHTVTLTAVINGVVKRVTRTFVVKAAGENFQPAFSATPSATVIPTAGPTVTVKPTIMVTVTATPKPTTTVAPSVKPSPSPTLKPTAAPTPVPTPPDKLEESGTTDFTNITLLAGCGLVIWGLWWYKRAY